MIEHVVCAAVTSAWRAVTPLPGRRREPPQPLHGHAAATVGTQMWIAGGRYGRKLLRSFFCFDTGPRHIHMSHWVTAQSFQSCLANPSLAVAVRHACRLTLKRSPRPGAIRCAIAGVASLCMSLSACLTVHFDLQRR